MTFVSVVVNPAAAAGTGARVAGAALAVLRENARVEVRHTEGASVAEVLRSAVSDGPDALVVCGGDGMVHAALQVVAGGELPLGVVPAGTGNDFARALGIPLHDPVAAARLIGGGSPRPVDLACVGDTWFGSVLACGFDSRVNARTNRMRWPRGRSRYTMATFAELASFRPVDFVVEVDGESREFSGMFVAVGNTTSYGGGMRICPAADPYDGQLDLTMVSAVSRIDLLRMFSSVYQGNHLRHPAVSTMRGQRVRISCAGVEAYADGEPVGDLPVEITLRPAAARVYTSS
ncbi:diacylglycerol/lipid kinase family protein [Fodinicola acaciae]|uniref:diacylglycerol/lipid kinase family protein n=1 Tax=Fodinicola acaciae TaxID=2681555 RepID=UPI0013D54B40|nr:YegS/Rv2252/BmrU family lipid kinase [Fodinicola acaciae]